MKADDWIPIELDKEDGLPEIGEYVLWRCQNGNIIHEQTDKSSEVHLRKFLEGNFFTGPLTHWQRVIQPKNTLSEELNKVEMEIESKEKENEIKFTLIYLETGEIRFKRVTGEWLMNRVFQSELKTWEKNGEGKVELKKYFVIKDYTSRPHEF
jgi:hypothetical protein